MEVKETLSYWWKPRRGGCCTLPVPMAGKTPFEILHNTLRGATAFPGDANWPVPLHLESSLQTELHLGRGKATFLPAAPRVSVRNQGCRFGSLQSNSCSQSQLSEYYPFTATVLQNERAGRKEEREIVALAEMINGKHFAFCLVIKPVQAELLYVLPNKIVYLQSS